MNAVVKPLERRTLDVQFKGQTYRIDLDHAHAINRRGHLKSYGWGDKITYYVEEDRMIDVRGVPLSSGDSAP
jgi:hypothetical protein